MVGFAVELLNGGGAVLSTTYITPEGGTQTRRRAFVNFNACSEAIEELLGKGLWLGWDDSGGGALE